MTATVTKIATALEVGDKLLGQNGVTEWVVRETYLDHIGRLTVKLARNLETVETHRASYDPQAEVEVVAIIEEPIEVRAAELEPGQALVGTDGQASAEILAVTVEANTVTVLASYVYDGTGSTFPIHFPLNEQVWVRP